MPKRPTPDLPPPAHLSERAKALWIRVVPERATAPERLAVIQAALEALDQADAAAALIREQGMTTTTRTTGAVHVNPLVKVEREAREQFTKLWCGVLRFHHERCDDPLAQLRR
jgi:P27 family predicted phage terminase small subunit